ncbi:aldehyde dehydrogenase [Ammoniphilus oxalaticus]|uniref:Aldehyde dehydrogenase n=1 Tax=Ammoniphilus oxalaticus TaxID=66863 RepID=A0A419SFS8_9BACL|nr:aldehyde dehydrogenase family protein [Ammoniphilus oxalaticus]RKD22643.1 aldehyde dehydrogenase [Ammoniphilus oxalaticus]
MRRKLYLNGEWVSAKHYTELRSPYTNGILAEVPLADKSEVDFAIQSADQARPIMAKMPAHQRAAILDRLSALLEQKAEEAARLIALEAAKPISAARGEIARTIQTFKFAAEEARRIYGETIPLDAAPGGEGRLAYTVREPLGVIGAITPFNFPMNLVAHKLGPAIAAGNTIVLKPASQTPLSAFFLAELLDEAGLPAGALNVVSGKGSEIGQMIVTDERVKMVTFTGSPSVGKRIREQAGLKSVTLELGSNSAVIIDRAIDVDKVVDRCVVGAFSFQGQVCIALQRIYVHEDLYDSFVEKFVEAAQRLKFGDPLDPETALSALITKADVQRCMQWIEEAKAEGAQVACGGTAKGQGLMPTVLLQTSPTMKVSCQEAFAPIVLIDKVQSVEEAFDRVNDSRYGLQAGIYTNDIHLAMEAAEQLQVGAVLINDIPTFRVDQMPYGGVKESGMGREGIKYALEEMTELKLVIINRN